MQSFKNETEDYIKSKYEYDIKDKIGNNPFGSVYKAKDLSNGNEIVALKVIIKKTIEDIGDTKQKEKVLDYVYKEIELLKKCECEYSVKLIEAVETEFNYYIIMEYCETNLKKYLYEKEDKKCLTNEEIRDLFKKFNIIIKIMHDNHIIHRDLKTENIFIKIDKKNNVITPKLADFDVEKEMKDTLDKAYEGTLYYMAPEVLQEKKHNECSDLWSIGTILYELLFRTLLYDGESKTTMLNQIESQMPRREAENEDLKDLMDRLLQYEPEKRIKFMDYINHKFFDDRLEQYNKKYKTECKFENGILSLKIDSNTTREMIKEFKELNIEDVKEFSISILKMENAEKLKWINDPYFINKEIELVFEYNRLKQLNNVEAIKQLPYNNIITKLDFTCNQMKIEGLTGLPFPNLKVLCLYINEIYDIDSLNKLPFNNLIELNLASNKIEDIQVLNKVPFKNLKTLYLYDNRIENVEVFARVPFLNLEKLKLYKNQINDVEIFSRVSFKNLLDLNLCRNRLEDLRIFSKAITKKLKVLNLCENIIEDIEVFGEVPFPDLEILYLKENSIFHIDALSKAKFKNLTILDLGVNQISEIDVLSQVPFTKLMRLDLGENSIKNIEVLGKVPFIDLKELNLSFNEIDNIEILSQVPFKNLVQINLSNNKIDNMDVFGKVPFSDLKVLYLSGNKIKDIEVLTQVPFKNVKEMRLCFNKIKNVEVFNRVTFRCLERLIIIIGNEIENKQPLDKFSSDVLL